MVTDHTVGQVIEKATVTFPRGLTFEQAKDLIRYIEANLPVEFSYSSFSSHAIEGQVRHKIENMAVDSFQFKRSEKKSKLSMLVFGIVPGQEIGGYRPEVPQLWDDIKGIVLNYFERNK